MPFVKDSQSADSASNQFKATTSGGSLFDRTILSPRSSNWGIYLTVILVAAAIYLACIISPPSLQDDVDAVQAQIARNMIASGDWVTPRLDGVIYLEKPPLIYWLIAASYKVFGVHDWAARIPIALSAIALCWLTAAFGIWAFGKRPGFYAGLCMATCVGLWLFTRVLIPDVMLTLTIDLGDVGVAARAGRGRSPSARVGILVGRMPGHRAAAEEPHRRRLSGVRGTNLPGSHAPDAFGADVEAAPSIRRHPDHSADRGSVACAGDTTQSALFRLHDAQRTRGVPRVPVVLHSSMNNCCAS